jgi:purine nucleoside permease
MPAWRFAASAVLALIAARTEAAGEPPIPVRVVVVTTFEIGKDSGDTPGEFQNWVERYPLTQTMPFIGNRPLRYNPGQHVLGVVTGMGKSHAAAAIMALGLDRRFDFSKAYWILAGIAGIDPAVGSVGSAAWAHHIIDGDAAYEIDAREIPKDWPIGIVPNNRATPYQTPPPPTKDDDVVQFHTLDAGLVDWAYQISRDTVLPDTPRLQKARAGYDSFPNALKPPFVLEGDTVSADRFWIGALSTAWAERWTGYWTHGQGIFATSAEEDTGYMQALNFLSHAHRVDLKRALDLRTASDYTTPPAGVSAARHLAGEADGSYGAYLESLDAAYRVGSRVVTELATHWDKYADGVPSGKP